MMIKKTFSILMISIIILVGCAKKQEMAKTIVFLCSDAASYITGTALTADG